MRFCFLKHPSRGHRKERCRWGCGHHPSLHNAKIGVGYRGLQVFPLFVLNLTIENILSPWGTVFSFFTYLEFLPRLLLF